MLQSQHKCVKRLSVLSSTVSFASIHVLHSPGPSLEWLPRIMIEAADAPASRE